MYKKKTKLNCYENSMWFIAADERMCKMCLSANNFIQSEIIKKNKKINK
jgi:hypothetical protein